MKYIPKNKINDIKKRRTILGLETVVNTDDFKIRICPPRKQGERTICFHSIDHVNPNYDGKPNSSIKADKMISVKDSLKNIIEDIDSGFYIRRVQV